MTEDFHLHRIEELQRQAVSLEDKNARLAAALGQAREELVKAQTQLLDLNRAPLSLAMFLSADTMTREVDVAFNGRRMRVAAAPALDLGALSCGQLVRMDERLVVVAPDEFPRSGAIASVLELVGAERVLVALEAGQEHLLTLAGPLRHGNLRPGDSLTVDLRAGVALEKITRSDVEQLLTPTIPDTRYEDIGGLDEQIRQVRDTIELPLKHPEMYRAYGLRPPKGLVRPAWIG